MPFDLPIPQQLQQAGWRVKIREKERVEEPHVTLIRKTQSWRLSLRTGGFLDSRPDPSDVPEQLLDFVRDPDQWSVLRSEWNRKYPQNPVGEA